MGQPVQRDGQWWAQGPDGAWLKWNQATQAWERPPAAPPPPPPPAATFTPGPYVNQPSVGQSTAPSAKAPVASASAFQGGFGSSRRPSKLLVGLLAAVVVAGAVAFGATQLLGSDGNVAAAQPATGHGAHAAKPDAKSMFLAKADGICRKAMEEMKGLLVPSTPEEVVPYLEKAEVIANEMVKDIRALKAPREDRKKLRKLFGLMDKAMAQMSAGVAAARRGDMTGVQVAMQRMVTAGQRFDGLALQYGFTECNKSE